MLLLLLVLFVSPMSSFDEGGKSRNAEGCKAPCLEASDNERDLGERRGIGGRFDSLLVVVPLLLFSSLSDGSMCLDICLCSQYGSATRISVFMGVVEIWSVSGGVSAWYLMAVYIPVVISPWIKRERQVCF